MATRHDWEINPHLWSKLKPLARQMRKAPTAAEYKLWQSIRKQQVREQKFRRQYTIDRFIVDFCCLSIRLIIEVDGPTHQYTRVEDAIRQEFLESLGFEVIRFQNLDVLNTIEAVMDCIDAVVMRKMTPS